jgi:hypothetical protein
MTYIEDYLEYLCKEKLNSLRSVDAIYYSIYKQTVRGLGLTDRQYALVLKKIQDYVSVEDLPTKIPLRTIDRSKYIKLVNTADVYGPDTVHESYKSNWKWIKVRFPFSKKDIVKIDSIQINHTEYFHKKGSHEHYYKFTPKNVHAVISVLQNRNFEIQDELKEYYEKVDKIKNSNFNTYNCLPESVLQELDKLTQLQQADRGFRYGYKKHKNNHESLSEKIAYRLEHDICVNPDTHKFNEVAQAVAELNRFPLLVLIDEDMSYPQLKQIHSGFDFVPNDKQSVLFRVDNKDATNAAVNDYIKEHGLNNWVDNSTQIVYIKKNKLPKVLLQADFNPICAIGKTSNRCNGNVNLYINLYCDCVIYHDKSLSLFRRTTSAYL